MKVEEARSDFPVMEELIYLDSASTSLTPVQVMDEVNAYELRYRANVGRGVHRLASVATHKYTDAHRKVSAFIGGEPGLLVFTRNTTEAINIVASGFPWKKGDRIVTTLLEHHSNYVPWLRLRDTLGLDLVVIPPDMQGRFDLSRFREEITPGTTLVAVSQASNVLGSVSPLREISRICKDAGSRLIVDGAQSVPHIPVNVGELGCDYFCFSGHKMLGPSGTGALWMKNPDLSPMLVGGGMISTVRADRYTEAEGYNRYEAGTPAIGSGIGLGRAADYLSGIGMENVRNHERNLTTRLLAGLSSIEGVTVYGPPPGDDRIGVVSFTVGTLHPHEVAHILDEAAGIMVRSGEHCAIPLLHHIGVPGGTVRASLHLYNNAEDVDALVQTVEEIARISA